MRLTTKVLMGLAALPFAASLAVAGQPLTAQQMDRVTAGFSALSIADAQGVVGESGALLVTTASASQVVPIATLRLDEFTSTLFKAVSAAQSSTVTSTITPAAIPGLTP
jgi:hypothetical protein